MKRITTILFLALVTISANAQQWYKQWCEKDPMYENVEEDWLYVYMLNGKAELSFKEHDVVLLIEPGQIIDYYYDSGNKKRVDVKAGFYIDGEFQKSYTWRATYVDASTCGFVGDAATFIQTWLLYSGEVRLIIPCYRGSFDKTFPRIVNPIVL